MTVAEKLKTIRKIKRLSQEDVAELLKTTQQQYSKYETGVVEIPVHHILTLCRYYGASSDWLLGLKDTMNTKSEVALLMQRHFFAGSMFIYDLPAGVGIFFTCTGTAVLLY